MSVTIHCIGKVHPDWEESINQFCNSLGIDIAWYRNVGSYHPDAPPAFVMWRAAKLTAEDRVNIDNNGNVKAPIVVFSYLDPMTMPLISKRVIEISRRNGAAGFFAVTYDFKKFVNQLKEINRQLHLRWVWS